jgi:hypothetical protein
VVILPGGGDLARRAVSQPRLRAVVIAVDVGADLLAGLVERFELLAPDAALLELGKPALDERLAFRVAVAAAAMRDAVLGEAAAEGAAGVGGGTVCRRSPSSPWDRSGTTSMVPASASTWP